jgi:hypothetical protein
LMPTDIIISCVFLLHINTPLTFFLRTASANLADLQIDLLQNHIISEPAAYSFALCMLFSGKKSIWCGRQDIYSSFLSVVSSETIYIPLREPNPFSRSTEEGGCTCTALHMMELKFSSTAIDSSVSPPKLTTLRLHAVRAAPELRATARRFCFCFIGSQNFIYTGAICRHLGSFRRFMI